MPSKENAMLMKIIAANEAEAVSEARKKSATCPDQINLFYCIRSQEYSVSDIDTPYAPYRGYFCY
nr:hypothetical protein [Mucilaginibacter sp. E4BP6]